MQVIQGRVQRFLHTNAGEINGLILDHGTKVRFPSEQSSQVSPMIEIGSNVEIHGWTRPGPVGRVQLDALAIINSDSNRMVFIKQLPSPHDPEVPPSSIPTSEQAASLAPLTQQGRAQGPTSGRAYNSTKGFTGEGTERGRLNDSQTALGSDSLLTGKSVTARSATREGAAKDIEHAYDGLHRTQAILAYVKIVDLKDPNVGQLLDEAKRSYEEALSNYQRENFSAARELAAASSDLSVAIEMVISWTFRSSANSPTLVPPPPVRHVTSTQSGQIQDRLYHVQKSLSRIRWLLENGTMPQEDIEEVQKIAAWSETFLFQARQMSQQWRIEDATEFAQAAEAVMHSAEHRCKKCYVALESDSRFAPTVSSSSH
jgi:hypothetical protein